MALESCHLSPGIPVCMPKAPVVVLTATPAFDGNGLAIDVQGAVKVCQRNASQYLGFGKPLAVQRKGQQERRRTRPAISETPADFPISGHRRSAEIALRQRAITDANVERL